MLLGAHLLFSYCRKRKLVVWKSVKVRSHFLLQLVCVDEGAWGRLWVFPVQSPWQWISGQKVSPRTHPPGYNGFCFCGGMRVIYLPFELEFKAGETMLYVFGSILGDTRTFSHSPVLSLMMTMSVKFVRHDLKGVRHDKWRHSLMMVKQLVWHLKHW